MTIIYFLILLSVVVVIHEAGHLIAAKLFGVYCYEFSIGMGPAVYSKKTDETVYSIRALPIGGYVSMAGEEDGDAAYPDVKVPDDRRLKNKKTWQKVIIMLAGVTMNFLLAWVLFSLIILSNGAYSGSPEPLVESVRENSPAEAAGFQAGDRIIKIEREDGSYVKPETFLDMQTFVSDGKPETYYVQRGSEEIALTVVPEYSEEAGTYMIGITGPSASIHKVNLLNCWYYGFAEMGMIVRLLITTIRSLFYGTGADQLSGPVGIYQATEAYAAMGLKSFLFLMAEISLNIGIFNLLPLPVLDGGQIVITLAEAAVHKELNAKVKTVIMLVCWVLLIGLMIFATWNDIRRLMGG